MHCLPLKIYPYHKREKEREREREREQEQALLKFDIHVYYVRDKYNKYMHIRNLGFKAGNVRSVISLMVFGKCNMLLPVSINGAL